MDGGESGGEERRRGGKRGRGERGKGKVSQSPALLERSLALYLGIRPQTSQFSALIGHRDQATQPPSRHPPCPGDLGAWLEGEC